MKRTLVAVAATLACLTAVLLAPPPAMAYTDAELRDRADQLMFQYTLSQFMHVKNTAKSGIDTAFNWTDDGCSGPPNPFSDNFRRSCERHDFAFRNYGNGLQLKPSEEMRLRINNQFRDDMNQQCDNQGNPSGCGSAVTTYYHFVNDLNNGAAAFYDPTCDAGYFCLYDDDDRGGWRVQLASRSSDFHHFADGDLNDNVKSVWNREGQAWRVYQNPDYTGNSSCISAGEVEDFGSFDGLNDELSSARPGC